MQKSKARKFLSTFFTIVMCSLLFAACGGAVGDGQADDVLVQSIVVKAPSKKNYNTGEQLNFAGMVITVNWDDGDITTITAPADGSLPQDVTVTGFNPGTPGTQVITVTYRGKSETFEVVITGVTKTVTSIVVTTKPAQIEYIVGESINYTGLIITATWNDNSKTTIKATTSSLPTGVTASGFSSTSAGEKTITVSYEGTTATFKVTVSGTSTTPVDASTIPVDAGCYHSLLIKTDGTVWAAGSNEGGQLGTGAVGDDKNLFTQVKKKDGGTITTVKNAATISAGHLFSLILLKDGTVWACGSNSYGQLGIGTSEDEISYFTKVKQEKGGVISEIKNAKAIAAGQYHSLILMDDGTVWAAGNNLDGELGIGTSGSAAGKNLFTQVLQTSGGTSTPVANATAIAAGYSHSLILKKDGTVFATGYNGDGQLGIGAKGTNKNIFTQVKKTSGTSVANAVTIAAGDYHSIILINDGTVMVAGSNSHGQLGIGESGYGKGKDLFTQVENNVILIAAGSAHSLILKADGTVWSTGFNYNGQLGVGKPETGYDKDSFTQAKQKSAAVNNVHAIVSGGFHSFILKKDGTIWVTGWNNKGQLGIGKSGDDSEELIFAQGKVNWK